MTIRLSAGWAIVSKPPGSYGEYAVLAASRTPYSPNQLNAVIRMVSPGNSPPVHEGPPVGLPWVWFTPIRAKDATEAHLGIVIREWTADTDGTNRRIAANRLYCVEIGELLSARCGFASLYDAVSEFEPPVITDNAHDREELALEVPGETPYSRQDPYHDLITYSAAALLDGPVTLLGGPGDLRSRLEFLDAIARWLPAGARAWLTAGVWVDAGTSRGIALAFTTGARGQDAVVDLRKTARHGRELSSHAAEYHRILGELSRKHGDEAVLAHLAGLTDMRDRTAEPVLRALEDLDLPNIALAEAESKTLAPHRVWRLWETRTIQRLVPADLGRILSALLSVLRLSDITTGRDVLIANRALLASNELSQAMLRMQGDQDTDAGLLYLAEFAKAINGAGEFVVALREAEQQRIGAFARGIPARALIDLAQDPSWTLHLAEFIVGSPAVSVAVAKLVFDERTEAHQQLIRVLDDAAPIDSVWSSTGDVFYRALGWRAPPVDHAAIQSMWIRDPDLIRALLSAGRSQLPSTTVDIVLQTVAGAAFVGGVNSAIPAPVAAELRNIRPTGHPQAVLRDHVLFLARSGIVVTRFDDEQYRRAAVELARYSQWSPAQRNSFLVFVAQSLGSGWSHECDAILQMLWDLVYTTPAATQSDEIVVLRAVAAEISHSRYRLLDAPAIGRWLPRLEHARILDPIVIQRTKLRELLLAEDTRTDVLADQSVSLLRVGASVEDFVSAFERTGWTSNGPRLMALVSRITALLVHERTESPAYAPGLELVRAHFDGRITAVDRHFARTLGISATAQLELAIRVLALAADRVRGKDEPPSRDETMRKLLGRVPDMVKNIYTPDSDGRRGLLPWRGRPTSDSDVER